MVDARVRAEAIRSTASAGGTVVADDMDVNKIGRLINGMTLRDDDDDNDPLPPWPSRDDLDGSRRWFVNGAAVVVNEIGRALAAPSPVPRPPPPLSKSTSTTSTASSIKAHHHDNQSIPCIGRPTGLSRLTLGGPAAAPPPPSPVIERKTATAAATAIATGTNSNNNTTTKIDGKSNHHHHSIHGLTTNVPVDPSTLPSITDAILNANLDVIRTHVLNVYASLSKEYDFGSFDDTNTSGSANDADKSKTNLNEMCFKMTLDQLIHHDPVFWAKGCILEPEFVCEPVTVTGGRTAGGLIKTKVVNNRKYSKRCDLVLISPREFITVVIELKNVPAFCMTKPSSTPMVQFITRLQHLTSSELGEQTFVQKWRKRSSWVPMKLSNYTVHQVAKKQTMEYFDLLVKYSNSIIQPPPPPALKSITSHMTPLSSHSQSVSSELVGRTVRMMSLVCVVGNVVGHVDTRFISTTPTTTTAISTTRNSSVSSLLSSRLDVSPFVISTK